MKKVIYTPLVGNYDTLKDPEYVMKGWDYLCFSNDLQQKDYTTWQIRPIPHPEKDKLRQSRYAKLNPHKLLADYEYSLWMDANIEVVSPLFEQVINDRLAAGPLISIPKHPQRNCIYKEAEVCIHKGKDFKWTIKRQIDYLKSNNFPENHGLYENNIILRKHNDHKIVLLSEDWWKLYRAFSNRDQLSLAFLLWKHKIDCVPLFPEGNSAQNFPGLRYYFHRLTPMEAYSENFKKAINRFTPA